ncbi:hypothetical protein MXB_665 [Myxobolus squamalis]|nr:hypothetical protein MXB_665 [Myxobolus squamalis]
MDIERKRTISLKFGCKFGMQNDKLFSQITPIITFRKMENFINSKTSEFYMYNLKRNFSIKCKFEKIINGNKRCRSCKTLITPLWRDTVEGITLCNACGIRFRKYQLMCNNCHYVPIKYEHGLIFCSACCQGTITKNINSHLKIM